MPAGFEVGVRDHHVFVRASSRSEVNSRTVVELHVDEPTVGHARKSRIGGESFDTEFHHDVAAANNKIVTESRYSPVAKRPFSTARAT
jgi:tRNA U38,U39,U40 pseudouridine synthase TruA